MSKKRKLMKLNAWAKREFAEGSIPSPTTLKRWLKINAIEGEVIGGAYYVYEDSCIQSQVSEGVSKTVDQLLRVSL